MRASAIEFRLRMFILVAIVGVGIWAPWIGPWDLGRRISTLEWLALEISRTGLESFTVSTPALVVLAALLAAVGMVFRVWGTAYLGYGVVHDAQMQAGAVMAAGPYCFVRTPLYIGTWFMMAAISFLMTPSGALFVMVLATVFQLRSDIRRGSISHQAARRALSRISPGGSSACAETSRGPATSLRRAALARSHRGGADADRRICYAGLLFVDL